MNFKMKQITFVGLLFVLFCLFSCEEEQIVKSDDEDSSTSVDVSNAVEGLVRIKISEASISQLSVSLKSGSVSSNITNLDSVLTAIGATSFERTFPYCGKFEERTKKAGLDRWYDVKYDTTNTELSIALNKFSTLSEVNITEPIRKIKNDAVAQRKFDGSIFAAALKGTSANSMDDSYFSWQWDLYNDGSVTGSLEGSDINVVNAWEVQTGSEEVIVAVVDGGIDYDHVELIDNMWINESEDSGSSSTDDDDNGYKDDIYGYNFVDGNGTIVAHDHGTHVAGTIAARSGNGMGICGVAGGDADHSGVKLMSCQVFETDEKSDEDISAEDFEAAIKYGADNGAVICQCSWGYDGVTSLPASMKEAIDYFIANAGYDENGSQSGPMAGGIVFFAAGNDATSINAYPAMYDEVVAVGAVGADYTVTSYSNYGSWIDIMAPGGEDAYTSDSDNEYILSTYPDDYLGWMIGTSQACPHVSGVAALIVSEYGGEGFTPDMLKEHLYQGAVDLEEYNPNYSGMYGVGLIDTEAAMMNSDSEPPLAVTDLEGSAESNTVNLSWSVTADEEGNTAYGYKVYYSTSQISAASFDSDDSDINVASIRVGAVDTGEELTKTISGLDYSTTYYFVVVGYNVGGSEGEVSNVVSAQTGENHSPIITASEGTSFSLSAHEELEVNISITEPDGDDYTYTYTDTSGGSTAEESTDGVTITINALNVEDNAEYSATLEVEDAFGATASIAISYTIAVNTAPKTTNTINDIYIGSLSTAASLSLEDYFSDEDGETLSYTLDYSESSLSLGVSSQTLTITPEVLGLSSVTVTAYDARYEEISQTFNVMVRDDSQDIDVYPNPVTDTVYFRLGEDVDGSLSVEVYNTNGVLVQEYSTAISTFSPGSVDLSDLASGKYLLMLKYGSEEYERNIVKL